MDQRLGSTDGRARNNSFTPCLQSPWIGRRLCSRQHHYRYTWTCSSKESFPILLYGLTFPLSRRHHDNHPPVRRHGETAVDSNLRRLCRAPLCLLPFHGNIPAVDGTYAGGNEPARQERLLSGLQHHGDEFCGSLEPICARRDIGQLGWVPYLLAKGKPFSHLTCFLRLDVATRLSRCRNARRDLDLCWNILPLRRRQRALDVGRRMQCAKETRPQGTKASAGRGRGDGQ